MSGNLESFSSAEVASFWRFISSSVSRLVAILDGLGEEELQWRPPAPDANSLNVLAMHTLGNLEENILQTLCGEPAHREYDEEFRADNISAQAVADRWTSLRQRVESALAILTTSDLDSPRMHPRRGEITGRDVLIVVARHAAEHLGQAELTRDLMRAAQSPVA